MDGQYATKEEFWKMQETLNDLSGIQSQHSERIMRLEKRRDDDVRVKGVWAPSSPFGNVLGSTPHPGMTFAELLVVLTNENRVNVEPDG